MNFNLKSKSYMCACALMPTFQNHSSRILQDILNEKVWFKDFFRIFVAECPFDASIVMLMFINHQVTLKFTWNLVS